MGRLPKKEPCIKKVLYVHYQKSDRGGAYTHTREFHQSFAKLCSERGISFAVVAPPLLAVDGSRTPHLAKLKTWLAPYYLHDLKTVSSQIFTAFSERAMLRQERPDIVLTRYNENTLSILWACRRERIPVAVEFNAPDSEKFLGRSHYYRLPGVQALFSNRHAFALSSGAFAVSEELISEFDQEAVRSKPVAVIPNGVRVERFTPGLSREPARKQWKIAADRIVVGYVAGFPTFHVLEGLLNRIAEMAAQLPELVFVIVGHVTCRESRLAEHIQASALSQHVILTGFVPPEEIPSVLAAIDIAVLPEAAPYRSPLKIFEYMAMARAIVAPGTNPIASVIEDRKEALLFEPGDFSDMARAIIVLARRPELRACLGAAARARAIQDFTWHRNAERVYEFLKSVYLAYMRDRDAT